MNEDQSTKQTKGGIARAKALSPKERAEIARKASNARWKAKTATRKAICEGDLRLGDTTVKCVILDDGTRVIASRGVMQALGRPWKGSYKRTGKPNFLDAPNLNYLISRDLDGVLEQIEYENLSGAVSQGYNALLIPKVCDIYLQARSDGTLRVNQQHVVERCEIIVRALAQIGIIALVDEATGFQGIRPKDALQQYLEKIVRKELAAWAKKFPDEFYENIYKLKGWPWPGMKKNRYSVVAHYTRDLVYERLAPSLLTELEAKAPKDEKGNRKSKLHQWLTDDVGNPLLAQHLHSLVMFQRLAVANGYGWSRFLRMVDQVLPKRGSTLPLPFGDS